MVLLFEHLVAKTNLSCLILGVKGIGDIFIQRFLRITQNPVNAVAPTGFMQYKTSDIIARVASINAAKLRNMQYYSQYMQNSAERILR